MFDEQKSPRVFALPIGVDFSGAFVDGLLGRMQGQPPEALARVVIYVNTRRSARGIEALLCTRGARLLPDIRVVTDLAKDTRFDLPQPIPSLRRQLIIARLVDAYLQHQPDVAPQSAVFDLADSLCALLDGFQGEGIAMQALHDIDVERQSEHWERSLKFLDILADYWGNHRPENAPDSEERQRAVAQKYAELWTNNPPQHPVIIAGSTGSRGATAVFMKAVASLPQGAVVLPGFDFTVTKDVRESMSADHPQFGFRNLVDTQGFPETPEIWSAHTPVKTSRNKLVSLALRPAPVTDQWLSEGPSLVPELPKICEDITLIEASSPRAEAEAIAVRLRQAADDGQKAALVTPDRVLARRVSSVLQRWAITPDDSAGRPLPLTPPGVFLRRLIALAALPLTPEGLLALLKHPLCGGVDDARINHLQMTRRLEMKVLRGGAPFIDWQALSEWAEEQDPQYVVWISWMQDALLSVSTAQPEMLLSEWLAIHRTAAEMLSVGLGEISDNPLWLKEAGLAAAATFSALENEAAYGGVINSTQYRALFQSELNRGEVREDAYLPHPSIAILGTLEARVQSADLVILGGLNEGIWPSAPKPDPWLSRDMRRQIGLPLPERQIGLSAHDFQQAMGAREVVISRAIRDGEAPTVASRWVIRLLNLLEGLGDTGSDALEKMRQRGNVLLAYAKVMNLPEMNMPPAKRPAPSPPIAARPDRLSVTRIETLIRDPYSIYADKVLRLRALDPPGKEADARERGNAIHNVMEEFLRETIDGLPDNAEEVFVQVAARVLEAEVPWPSTRRLWMARLEKIAPWFITGERIRRERANPLVQECKGTRDIYGLNAKFTLSAKADRIDLAVNGGVAIYDYKSGGTPTKKQIKSYAVQLPLEAAIAQAGGFDGIAKAKVNHLELIGLGGGGKEEILDVEGGAIDEIWKDFITLIEAYGSPDLGYLARSRSELLTYESDFDHLSRFGEWQDGDDYDVEVLK